MIEIKNYECNNKNYSKETIEAFWRIYCVHDCDNYKVSSECFSIKKIYIKGEK